MGTRHLMCIYHAGRIKIAQYGHWDGYPGGAGVQILRFLRTPLNIARLRAGLPFIKISTEKFYCIRAVDQSPYLGSAQFMPQLAEAGDKGGEIQVEVGMDLDFARDTWFCEWAYVVDLDGECLEAYKGFGDSLLRDCGLEIGKGKLAEVGVQEQVLVGRWKFGDPMEDEEWVRVCLAPEKAAKAELDKMYGNGKRFDGA